MIIRIFGILIGVFFVGSSAMMFYIGQEGLIAKIGIFVVGLIFTAYGLIGPNRMAKFMPAAVKEIGGESLPRESNHDGQ
ncbi:hypothetical protein [Spongiibacter marinus]|uniref:hypothetical protein n=1 Tax=Spongiibacter marinus TaxID=354246 RepID=UPI0035BE5497